MQRILVTGESGFIGRSLLPALDRAGYFVRAATRQPMALAGAHESITISDLSRPIAWAPIVNGMDAVIHLAAIAHIDSGFPDDLYDRVNRAATQELVAAARASGLKHFILISSIRAQSGAHAEQVLSEADEPRPTDAYGRSKLGAEHAVREGGVPFTIFRPVVVYGPGVKGNVAILLRLAALRCPLPLGRFENRRSLLALTNFIDAINFSLEHRATVGETYIVADDDALAMTEILATMQEAYGGRRRLISVPPKALELALKAIRQDEHWYRLGGNLVVSTRKLKGTGWRPKVDTRSGLADLIIHKAKDEAAARARNAGRQI